MTPAPIARHGSEGDAWRAVAWAAGPLTLAALGVLAATGHGVLALLLAGNAALLALLTWLTILVTGPRVPEATGPRPGAARLVAQYFVVLGAVVVTAIGARAVPGWRSVVAWVHALGEATLPVAWFGGPGNALANPFQYLVVPLLLLLALGARFADLGFGPGHRVGRAVLVWSAPLALLAAAALPLGLVDVATLARRVIANTFQNGFFEEFLFRGALQTRLRLLVPAPWAIVLQAGTFGLWHLRATTDAMGGDPVAGLALCLASQAVSGFAFGIVFHRTGNLVAPSIAHVAMNVVGQTVG